MRGALVVLLLGMVGVLGTSCGSSCGAQMANCKGPESGEPLAVKPFDPCSDPAHDPMWCYCGIVVMEGQPPPCPPYRAPPDAGTGAPVAGMTPP